MWASVLFRRHLSVAGFGADTGSSARQPTAQSASMTVFEMTSMSMYELKTGSVRLCCTNPVRDSSCESSVIAGVYEQTEHTDLQDAELARV